MTRAIGICVTCLLVLGSPMRAAAQGPIPTTSVPADNRTIGAKVEWPSFGSIVEDTIHDFRRLPSEDSLKWLGIGGAIAAIGHRVDQPVSRELSTSATLDGVFDSGTTLGGARLQMGAALATFAIGRVTRSPRVALVGADLLKAQLMSQALTAAVKMSVRRTRPDGTQYSFPSGHSSVTFATATVLQRDLGWKVGIPAYGLATFVAASRIQEKRHFLSDVAFGAAIGIMSGRTVTLGRGDRRFAVSPMAAPSGVGVSFVWVGR
jgi:membrane-associated phospholipid phosphatase